MPITRNPVLHTKAIVGRHMRHAVIVLHHARINTHTPVRTLLGTWSILLWIVHHVLRLLSHMLLCGLWGILCIRVVAGLLLWVVDTTTDTLAEAISGSIHGLKPFEKASNQNCDETVKVRMQPLGYDRRQDMAERSVVECGSMAVTCIGCRFNAVALRAEDSRKPKQGPVCWGLTFG
jgi:hypothetical protein